MKDYRHVIAVGAMVIVMAAPGAALASDETSEQAESDVPEQATDEGWSETVESLKSYSAEQRDKAVAAGKKTLDAMDQRIDKLEAWTSRHWSSLSEESREKKTAMLNSMREQRRKVAEWYGGMKHSSSEAWDGVKQGFIRSYDKLQAAYEDAMASFNEEEKEQAAGE